MIDGFKYFPGLLTPASQKNILDSVFRIIDDAPYFYGAMPGTGKALSVAMSNAGQFGWYSDREGGYRYITEHPETGRPWPSIPDEILSVWWSVADYDHAPECCLINRYSGAAKMGLHQDRDEQDMTAPVVSISLGDDALFRLGGTTRKAPTRSFKLASGDVLVLGGAARLAFHGVDRVIGGTSRLLPGGGRINLTLRRVTPP